MVRMLCNTYSSLHVRIRMVEVLQVLIAIDPGGHRRDIESEESTADGAESGERVDVCDLVHFDNIEQSLTSERIADSNPGTDENNEEERGKTNAALNTSQITDMSSHKRIRYSTTVY